MDDRVLLAGVAARDPEAFRALMERHAGPVVNLAYRFLGTVADAEDAAQDVFLKLYQHPPPPQSTPKLSTWLYRVTANRCIDQLRRPGRHQISIDVNPGSDPEGPPLSEILPARTAGPREQAVRSEAAEATRRAVAALPVDLRAPLILSTVELSQQEIAGILGMSVKAVERRIARARDILRDRLSEYL